MIERSKKPSALSSVTAPTSQLQITTSHSNSQVSAVLPTGESIEILLYGATIISWKDNAGHDLLWLSEAAKLDGSRAVRGGIPLVFPVFSTDSSHESTAKLPSHGFARTSYWEFLGKSTSESGDDDSVKFDFGLSPNNLTEESKKLWPFYFGLIYSVTLSQNKLTTSLLVRNEDQKVWDFQALMHTYFRVQDIFKVEVTGLESASYIDKTTNPISLGTSSTDPLKIKSRTDKVYTVASSQETPITLVEDGIKKFGIVRDNMNEVVVWNPWSEHAANIDDFSPKEGYQAMICVEAGALKGWIELGPGDTWEGSQTITLN